MKISAARSARSTVVSVAASMPGATRTVAAPITISTSEAPWPSFADTGAVRLGKACSTTTGTKAVPYAGGSSLAPLRPPLRLAPPAKELLRRQPMAPCDSRNRVAVLVDLCEDLRLSAGGHVRRRPEPVNTSSRRTGSGFDLGKSSVSDTCPTRSSQRARHSPIAAWPSRCGREAAYSVSTNCELRELENAERPDFPIEILQDRCARFSRRHLL